MSKQSYIMGFCKQAESHGVSPEALAKYAAESGTSFWDSVKGAIDSAAARYAQFDEKSRMALNSALGGLAGAGIGGIAAGRGNRLKGALLGALAGAPAGAMATKYLSSPRAFIESAGRGTNRMLTGDVAHNDEIGRNFIKWLADNAEAKGHTDQARVGRAIAEGLGNGSSGLVQHFDGVHTFDIPKD